MIKDKLVQDIAATRMLGAVDPAMPNDALVDPLAQQQIEQEAAQMALAAVEADEAAAAPVASPDATAPAAPAAPPADQQGATQESGSVSMPVVTSKYANSKGLIGDAGRIMEADVAGISALGAQAEDLYAQRMDAIKRKEAVEVEAAERDASLMEEYEADKDEAYNQAVGKITAADEDIRRLAEREPDPGRFWETRSDGQKALYFLTMALQAFSDPSKSPSISDQLEKFVDRDIKMQEDRMAREVDAAQGRARSVRELIAMSSDKEEAIYRARQSRYLALYKMAMAPVNASMETAQAKEGRLQIADSLLGKMTETRQRFFNNKLQASEQSLAQAKFAYQKKQDALAARQAAGQQANIPEGGQFIMDSAEGLVDPRTGKPERYIVIDPKHRGKAADVVTGHSVAQDGLQRLRSYIAEKEAEGWSSARIRLDPEFRTRLASTVRPIAAAMGYEKNVSDRESAQIEEALTSGRDLDSLSGLTFGTTVRALLNTPGNMVDSVDNTAGMIDRKASQWMEASADVNYYGGKKPQIILRKPTTESKEDRTRGIVQARGSKEVVFPSKDAEANAEAILYNTPIGTSPGYETAREVARNTMHLSEAEQTAKIAEVARALPAGSKSQRRTIKLAEDLRRYRELQAKLGLGAMDVSGDIGKTVRELKEAEALAKSIGLKK